MNNLYRIQFYTFKIIFCVTNFTSSMYHEMLHYICAIVMFILGLCRFPKLFITRYPNYKYVGDNCTEITYMHCYVEMSFNRCYPKKYIIRNIFMIFQLLAPTIVSSLFMIFFLC